MNEAGTFCGVAATISLALPFPKFKGGVGLLGVMLNLGRCGFDGVFNRVGLSRKGEESPLS